MDGRELLKTLLTFAIFVHFPEAICDCSESSCKNGAACLDAYLDPGYICLCPSNFTGADCATISGYGCHHTYSDKSGIISSPNFPDQHNNSENCLYHIRVPSAVNITLNITYMNTERLKDYLFIGQGTNETQGWEYSGLLDEPEVVIFHGNHVFLSWHSDFNVIQKGWIVEYESDGVECEWTTDPCEPGYQCIEGYASFACEDIDECLSSPCLNNGTCKNLLSAYECVCPDGWNGTNCQEGAPCMSGPCYNEAECINTGDGFLCICNQGFSGPTCTFNIDECASSPCINGGTCIDVVGGYLCICTAAWSGKDCQLQSTCIVDLAIQYNETLVIQTPNFPSNYNNNQFCRWTISGPEGAFLQVETNVFHTELNYDWVRYGVGSNASSPESQMLEVSGSDIPITFRIEGNQMWMTFASDNDKTENGISVKITVELERDSTNECGSIPCLNGASCLNGIDKFTCYCLPDFSGPLCATEINPNMCSNNRCPPEAECVSQSKQIRCICPEGFKHPSCSTHDIGLCDSAPCKNSGVCTETINGLSFSCDCVDGWQGTFCEIDTDECLSGPCLNSGICVNGINSFTCVCTPYWTGITCNVPLIHQQCLNSQCRNGATCIPRGDGYECVCRPGYQGVLCSTDINECESNPCLNGGSCVNGINEYICQCPYGPAQGTNCETTICQTTPCQNEGTCEELNNFHFACLCPVGFVGQFCEVPTSKSCDGSYCNYNGICVVTEQQVQFCSCYGGYSGDHCETVKDACRGHQCQNGATCYQSGIIDYGCLCPQGYEGQFCHLEIDECASNPCINGGTCKDLFNSFSCTCSEGYIGDLCNTKLIIRDKNATVQGSRLEIEWLIIIIVLCVFTLFLTMGLLCVCCRRQRKDT